MLSVAIRRAECACSSTCFEQALAAFTAPLLASKVFHVQQLRCSVVAHLRQVMFLMKHFWNVALLACDRFYHDISYRCQMKAYGWFFFRTDDRSLRGCCQFVSIVCVRVQE